jgi:hypothetical protein
MSADSRAALAQRWQGVLPLVFSVVVASVFAADVLVTLSLSRARLTGAAPTWLLALSVDIHVLTLVLLGTVVVYLASVVGPDWATPRHWSRAWICVLTLAVATAVLVNWLAALVTVVLYVAVLRIGPRLALGNDRSLTSVLSVAFVLRLAVAVGLDLYGALTHDLLAVFDDEVALHRAAVELAGVLAAGAGDLNQEWWHLTGYHLDFVAFIYATIGPDFGSVRTIPVILGTDFAIIRALNVAGGALVVAISFGLVGKLASPAPARHAAWLVALWPTQVFWSGTGLREVPTWIMLLMVGWLIARASAPMRILALIAAAVSLTLLVLSSLRFQAAFAVEVGLVVVAAMRLRLRRARAPLPIGLAVVLGVVVLVAALRPPAILNELTPIALEHRAAATELTPMVELTVSKQPPRPAPSVLSIGNIVRVQTGDSSHYVSGIIAGWRAQPLAYEVRLDADTVIVVPPEAIYPFNERTVGWDALLGRALVGTWLVFVPLPLGSHPLQRAAAIPDTLVWDALCVLAAFSAGQAGRKIPAVSVLILVSTLVVVGGMVLIETSIGTIVRQRAMLEPGLIVVAAVPLWLVWLRLARALGLAQPEELGERARGAPYEPRVVA